MKDLTEKGEKFYTRWEEHRKKKWYYAFLNGSVYWGLSMALIIFLLHSQFQFENMKWSELLVYVIFFGIGGIFNGLREFRRIDRVYLSLNDDEEISKGVQGLKSGKEWNYENLLVLNVKDENLTIRNEFFWFDNRISSSEKSDECFQAVYNDFMRLRKNQEFEDYIKNKHVVIQIVDNPESPVPLVEKIV